MNEVFRTIVEPIAPEFQISHQTQLIAIGSCFAENIGERLQRLKFKIDLNPFGVIFNPASIAKNIYRLIEGRIFSDDELFNANESWHSFMHHSRFSSPDKWVCLDNINSRLILSANALQKAEIIIFTFGTAWVYKLKESGSIVANCHKLPASSFERYMLSVDEIINEYGILVERLRAINPNVKIIFTVSPVRHLKDTAHGNQVSKSILLLAVNQLCQQLNAYYFPAYEIMLDDLRDYRYYDNDMVHPSALAIEYIFNKFGNTFFNAVTQEINQEINNIHTALNHKVINPQSVAYKVFSKSTRDKIIKLTEKHNYLDLSRELAKLTNV